MGKQEFVTCCTRREWTGVVLIWNGVFEFEGAKSGMEGDMSPIL